MPDPDDATAYQSLYRRFRPRRFADVLGQDHVALALRNAVRDGRVGHAYLFSGPRGTGKTSTARILAMALDCADPEDGEPCGRCPSCVEIARGTSLDVHELDAASNNGVEAMRELVGRAALGTPGRWKVYIVDEVHMLSTAASNALLKTLEEPPGHVVFVLATTDPQKVLPTIRSRTQHFEFRLLGADTLAGLLRQVRADAALGVGDDAVEAAVRRGRGSARDALSALDQLAAGGVVDDDAEVVAELAEAVAAHDATAALGAVARALDAGRDPQRLAIDVVDHLRQGFLAQVAPELLTVTGAERARATALGAAAGLALLVRAMERLGRAQVDMRDAADPRVHLEVALVRLTHPAADDDNAALVERIERLERMLADGAAPPRPSLAPDAARVASDPAPASADPPAADAPAGSAPGPSLARQSLGALRRQARAQASSTAAPSPSATEPAPAPAAERPAPSPGAERPPPAAPTTPGRDDLVQAWGDGLLASLPGRARARFRVGRFVDVAGGTAVFALPNETHRSYCEEVRLEVEAALGAHFGAPVPLRLVVDPDESPAPAADESPGEEHEALLDRQVLDAETAPAGNALSAAERIKRAFPGAEEV